MFYVSGPVAGATEDSTVGYGGVSNPSCKPMEMDKCKPKSDISNLEDNYRDGTGGLEMDVDSPNLL